LEILNATKQKSFCVSVAISVSLTSLSLSVIHRKRERERERGRGREREREREREGEGRGERETEKSFYHCPVANFVTPERKSAFEITVSILTKNTTQGVSNTC
jgi:hypothetical protein